LPKPQTFQLLDKDGRCQQPGGEQYREATDHDYRQERKKEPNVEAPENSHLRSMSSL
jgi:hypothetical protein